MERTNPDFKEKEKQANVFIETARIFARSNKTDESIKNYKMALKIFEEIGFSFQVRKIKWEIEKLQSGTLNNIIDDRLVPEISMIFYKGDRFHSSLFGSQQPR